MAIQLNALSMILSSFLSQFWSFFLQVKRFAEGFFTYEFPKQALVACYDPR